MIRQQIQRALQIKKLTSTSDLVLFIIQQVNKISYLDPIQQLSMRINELQKPKGLDNVMLEEVKTIVEAMIDQREEMIVEKVDELMGDKIVRLEEMVQGKMLGKVEELFDEYMVEKEQKRNDILKNQRQYQRPTALRQINSLQFTNTDSLSLDNFYKPRTISQDLYSKNNFNSTTALTSKTLSNRNSFKKINNNHQSSPLQQNQNILLSNKMLSSDSKTLRKCYNANVNLNQLAQNIYQSNNQKSNNNNNHIKQTLTQHNKQIQDLKHTIIQLQRSLTDKLNLQEIHQIMAQFQSQIYQNIQNDKIHFQNLQFTLKKQLQSQILNLKKQTFNQLLSNQEMNKSFSQINKEILALKKAQQKRTLKYQKLKSSVKQLSQQQKSINSSQLLIEKSIKSQKAQLQKYVQLNNSKNEDLGCLLQQINEKMQYLDKVKQIEHNFTLIKSNIATAQYQTQFRTKNDKIVWQRQVYNFDPKLFRFQTNKSQIIINEKGVYQIEFILMGSKTIQEFLGTFQIVSAGVNFNKRQVKILSNQNLLKYFVQIEQKSFVSLKISNCENQTISISDLVGFIKVSKF